MNDTTAWAAGLREAMSAYAGESDRATAQLGMANVLIAGNAGVGKSTLANGAFGIELAKTGVGESQTQDITAYTVPGKPFRLYDTRGFELKHAEQTIAAVRGKIEELRRQTDPNEQIHIAWLCILEQSHRVEQVHRTFLETLRALAVPTIVVITQALGEAEMEAKVRELAIPNNAVVPVLAQSRRIAGQMVPSYGLDDLVDATLRLLPEAQRGAFTAAQNARWDLKEAAAVATINAAATAAGASALVPVPGGHSAALLVIQATMLADINAQLGVTGGSGTREMITGMVGTLLARIGGQAAFAMAFSEVARFIPGPGWLGAAAVGGPIGATITKVFGHLYLDAVKLYAREGPALPDPEKLANRMRELLERDQERYSGLGRQ